MSDLVCYQTFGLWALTLWGMFCRCRLSLSGQMLFVRHCALLYFWSLGDSFVGMFCRCRLFLSGGVFCKTCCATKRLVSRRRLRGHVLSLPTLSFCAGVVLDFLHYRTFGLWATPLGGMLLSLPTLSFWTLSFVGMFCRCRLFPSCIWLALGRPLICSWRKLGLHLVCTWFAYVRGGHLV